MMGDLAPSPKRQRLGRDPAESEERTFVERAGRPAAIAGYVGLYAGLVLVFICFFFESFLAVWAIVLLSLCSVGVVAGIALNFKGVLGAFRTKRGVAGMSMALSVAAAVIIFVAVNWLSYRHYVKWDITEDERFTLSGITRNWLETLDERGKTLEIVTFLPYRPMSPYSNVPGDYKRRIMDLLELYKDQSERLKVAHTRPLQERASTVEAARKIGLDEKSIPNETVVLKYGDRRKKVGVKDIFKSPWSPPQARQRPKPEFVGEGAITSAIRDLLDEEKKNVYFVVGHGERTTGYEKPDLSMLADELRGMNFEPKELNIAEKHGVPEDADCVVIAGPTGPIPAGAAGGMNQLKAIEDYLEGGGNLIVMVDSLVLNRRDRPSGLDKVLKRYGVEVHQDVLAIGPEMISPFSRSLNPNIPTQGSPLGTHEISETLRGERKPALLYQACALETSPQGEGGYKTWRLLEGNADSWGESKLDRSIRYDQDSDDVPGPVILAVAVGPEETPMPGMELPETPAKIVVFADADFVSNQLLEVPELREGSINVALFLNAVNWMVGRKENIDIPPRERDTRIAIMTQSRKTRLLWGAVIGPVLLVVALGIYVWRVRSR